MIQGFETETAPLNEYETDTLLPIMVRCLNAKIGADMAVKNGYITKRLKEKGYNIDEVRVRKLINHIRVNGLVNCLIATSKGYYRATSKEEVCEYIASLKNREEAIRAVRRSLEKQAGL